MSVGRKSFNLTAHFGSFLEHLKRFHLQRAKVRMLLCFFSPLGGGSFFLGYFPRAGFALDA